MLFLDMVNKVLSAIDSQSVSSIDDSDESEQVANIVQRAYDEILYMRNWAFLQTEGTLKPAYTEPNHMVVPDDCLSLIRVKYKKKSIAYISPNDFRDLIDSRYTASANVISDGIYTEEVTPRVTYVDTASVNVNSNGIYTDRDPRFYTSFDDETLIFDSYDDNYANLLETFSYSLYSRMPLEINSDQDEFDLPLRFQPILLGYSVSLAMEELKGDSQAAKRYDEKYRVGVSRMLKWSKTMYENEQRYDTKINYGKRRM